MIPYFHGKHLIASSTVLHVTCLSIFHQVAFSVFPPHRIFQAWHGLRRPQREGFTSNPRHRSRRRRRVHVHRSEPLRRGHLYRLHLPRGHQGCEEEPIRPKTKQEQQQQQQDADAATAAIQPTAAAATTTVPNATAATPSATTTVLPEDVHATILFSPR